jgi:hypothetical protein
MFKHETFSHSAMLGLTNIFQMQGTASRPPYQDGQIVLL